MMDKTTMLFKLRMRIRRIEKFDGIGLQENYIMTEEKFYSMDFFKANSFLLNVIVDLKNMSNEFEHTGKIEFRSKNYIKMLEEMGFIVQKNEYKYTATMREEE